MVKKTDFFIFPEGFLWGSATSSHQVEGGNFNNWSSFEEEEGRIKSGEKSGIACDHYNRYEEDYNLLESLNHTAYRMSLEWSRIIPEEGEIDQGALNHYRKMIESLLVKKIIPFVTIHHFTHPLFFEEKGGFLKEENLKHFKFYCETIAEEYKDLLIVWNTINEPNVVTSAGFFLGTFPPGEKSFVKYKKALRNILRAHAIAYTTLKEINPEWKIGIVKNISYFKPKRRFSLSSWLGAKILNWTFNMSTIKALKTGRLPLSLFKKYPNLKNSSDFIGLNYYVKVNASIGAIIKGKITMEEEGKRMTQMNWTSYPEGLYKSIKLISKHFPEKEIYVTENGIATLDDEWRKEYIVEHLMATSKAISEGAKVRGFFYWSTMDNFEWTHGYGPKFGLIGVDPETLERKIKGSGRMYAKIAKENKVRKKWEEN
jgi:beta-glucosidase